ncbi:MAG: TetR/AcrR family transcriptional regulator, partial [Gordonia sp. (in: high G+C Gram-positive bacteria)]
FVEYLTADPRRARVVLIEVVGVSPAMEQRRNAVLSEFADVVRAVWSTAEGGRELSVVEQSTAVALVGAVNHLLVDWLLSGQKHSVEHLVTVCATLFEAAADKLGIDTD